MYVLLCNVYFIVFLSIYAFFLFLLYVIVDLVFLHVFFFFFKQRTAYEMRISDWSSDVFSSDLRSSSTVCARDRSSALMETEVMFRLFGFRLRVGLAARFGVALNWTAALSATLARPSAVTPGKMCRLKLRPEGARVGKACVSTGRSRWSTDH